MNASPPKLIIFAGANGSGKTTAAKYLLTLPHFSVREFVNADEIARGLSPFNPDGQALKSGRLMLQRINELIDSGDNFAFETTLASRSFLKIIESAKKRGYLCRLYFFYTDTADININRIKRRVMEGGHHVPDKDVKRRYNRGLQNLVHLYWNICDTIAVYDISRGGMQDIAFKTRSGKTCPMNLDLWKRIKEKAGKNE